MFFASLPHITMEDQSHVSGLPLSLSTGLNLSHHHMAATARIDGGHPSPAHHTSSPFPSAPALRADQRLFFQLLVSIAVSIGNGSIFCFSLMSDALTHGGYNFGSTDITFLGTLGVVASYFSLPTGLLYDAYGPKLTIAAGAMINAAGWGYMALLFGGHIEVTLGTVALGVATTQWAASFYESGTVLTNLECFSLHRGSVIVIQKTFMGLGSAIMAIFYAAFMAPPQHPFYVFCIFLWIFNTGVGVAGALVVRRPTVSDLVIGINKGRDATDSRAPVPPPESSPTSASHAAPPALAAAAYKSAFLFGEGLLIALVLVVLAGTFLQVVVPFSHLWRSLFAALVLLLLLLLPGMVFFLPDKVADCGTAARSVPDDSSLSSINEASHLVVDATAGVQTEASSHAAGKGAGDGRTELQTTAAVPINSSTLWTNLQASRDLYLLWFISFSVWSVGTVVSSNSQLIYQAVAGPQYSSVVNAAFVSIYAGGNAAGRLLVGFSLPWLLSRGGEVWHFLYVPPVLGVVGCGLMLVCPVQGLAVPFLMCGIATGVTWGSTVLVVKRLYERSGAHYNVLYTAGVLSPFVFNIGLFNWNFKHASHQQGVARADQCRGVACFAWTLVALMVCCTLALGAAWLFIRGVLRGGAMRR